MKKYDTSRQIETFVQSQDAFTEEMNRNPEWVEYRKIYDHISLFQEIDYPIHVDIENIYACNLACPTCERTRVNQPEGKVMSDELFKKVIAEATALGTKAIGFAAWGEALLDRKIFDRIKYAREKGILDVRLHSNGQIITQEIADKIIQSGVTWMNVSLDAATPQTYEIVRGGDYEKAVSAVGYLLISRLKYSTLIPKLRVAFVLQKANEDEWNLFRNMYDGLADIALESFRDRKGLLGDSFQPKTGKEMKFDCDRCMQPFERVFIRCDGTVNPCCTDINNELSYGNINDRSLSELWNSPKAKQLRLEMTTRKPNKMCEFCMNH